MRRRITRSCWIPFALAMLVSVFVSPSAKAADVDVAVARIYRVGIDPRFAGPMVQLIDESPNPRWSSDRQFYLHPSLGNAGLATLLTAMTLDKTLFVRILDNGIEGSLISIIFINE